MSKAAEVVNALRTAIAAIGLPTPLFTVTTEQRPLLECADRTVMILPEKWRRDPAGSGYARWTLHVLIILVSRGQPEAAADSAHTSWLDDAAALYEGVRKAAQIQPQTLGIEQPVREEMHFAAPGSAPQARPAIAAFTLMVCWKEDET